MLDLFASGLLRDGDETVFDCCEHGATHCCGKVAGKEVLEGLVVFATLVRTRLRDVLPSLELGGFGGAIWTVLLYRTGVLDDA